MTTRNETPKPSVGRGPSFTVVAPRSDLDSVSGVSLPKGAKTRQVKPPVAHQMTVAQYRSLTTPLEREVQADITKTLGMLGYLVMHTDQRRKSGVSIGLPDLFVTRADGSWGNRWRALEVKRPNIGILSNVQANLRALGVIAIATTAEEALAELREVI